MEKSCGKCGVKINSQVNYAEDGACSEVALNKYARDFLSKTYYLCLCKACLDKILIDLNALQNYSLPTGKETFVEGVHYYLEGDKWVFTELYHLLKGYCCKNNCRHCVYG